MLPPLLAPPLPLPLTTAAATAGTAAPTHHSTDTVIGTRPYMAPEYLVQGQVSAKTDTYAYGVVLLELLRFEVVDVLLLLRLDEEVPDAPPLAFFFFASFYTFFFFFNFFLFFIYYVIIN